MSFSADKPVGGKRGRSSSKWKGLDRRLEARLWCADLIQVSWIDPDGQAHETAANLEDISFSGACLQVDKPIPAQALIRIAHPKAALEGRVRYCVFRDTGYYIGVKFEPGCKWNRSEFRPKHLLDPRRLVSLAAKEGSKDPRPGE